MFGSLRVWLPIVQLQNYVYKAKPRALWERRTGRGRGGGSGDGGEVLGAGYLSRVFP